MILIQGAKDTSGRDLLLEISDEIINLNKNKNKNKNIKNIFSPSPDQKINAEGLIALPGMIDPHVHFRIPGQSEKEDWAHAAKAALAGGYTTVVDMPNNIPACVSAERLEEKIKLIDQQLRQESKHTPGLENFNYFLYIGADRKNFDQINLVKKNSKIVGIKVFMGSSTGDLLMEDDSSLHAIFALAKAHNLLIAVHAEDNGIISGCALNYPNSENFEDHSKIRDRKAAIKSVQLALSLADLYGVKLYILHVSTKEEVALIREAKQAGIRVFAEVCPHHLFLNTGAYSVLKGFAKMNPPLRDSEDQAALFSGIHEGVIDTIGSDHAPHTRAEKSVSQINHCPSGVPGIETSLALLLNAVHEKKIELKILENLVVHGPRKLFGFKSFEYKNTVYKTHSIEETERNWTLIDLNNSTTVPEGPAGLYTKCGWSPFSGQRLQGHCVGVILQGQLFFTGG